MHLVRELGYRGPTPQGEIAGESLPLADGGSKAPILIHPFVSAFGRFKEWPLGHWIELAGQLAQKNETVWVSGTPAERARVEEWVADSSPQIEMAPETRDTADLAKLVRSCRAVVAADTGIVHLSSMLGIPTIGLYGPKDPSVHGPLGPRSVTLRSGVPCSPCPLRDCEHSLCMSSIGVDQVLSALETLLDPQRVS